MALEGAFKCDNTHIFQEFKDIAPFFQIFHQKICLYPSNMTKRFSPMWSYDNPTRHRQPLLNVTIHKTSRRSDTMRRVYSNMLSVTTLTSLKYISGWIEERMCIRRQLQNVFKSSCKMFTSCFRYTQYLICLSSFAYMLQLY